LSQESSSAMSMAQNTPSTARTRRDWIPVTSTGMRESDGAPSASNYRSGNGWDKAA
jgi:hypothetical protein